MNSIEQEECVITGNINEKNDNLLLTDTIKGKMSGIYKIVNKTNGKYYVGKAKKFGNRWRGHRSLLNKNKHHNEHLQNAWNKYGEDNFNFVIIELTDPHFKILKDTEQRHLDIAKMEQNKCYNLSFLSDTIEITDEVRRKISLKSKGNTYKRGKKTSEYTSKLLSEKLKEYHSNVGPTQNPMYENTKYHFFNKRINKHFIGTPYEMSMKYSLNRTCILRLKRKFLQQHKGWVILTT